VTLQCGEELLPKESRIHCGYFNGDMGRDLTCGDFNADGFPNIAAAAPGPTGPCANTPGKVR
jgi:hypothetical protein